MFHFNKKHLEDPTIPMWVVKAHGVTFYVNHVTADMPWSTKETPDNDKTKGSIKFQKCKLVIDDDNCATISKLGVLESLTLDHPRVVHARIMAANGGKFHCALKLGEFKHSKIKFIQGACSSGYIICDLLEPKEITMASLKYTRDFRILSANEVYYKEYAKTGDFIDEDALWDEDEDD